MIPSLRLYQLLLLGTAVGLAIALVGGERTNPPMLAIALGVTALYDLVILSLGVWDGRGVKAHRLQVSRQPLQKLSIGRENPVQLTVQTGDMRSVQVNQRPVQLQIRDDYPAAFKSSTDKGTDSLQITVSPNQTETLTYTVLPGKRGEYRWGNIQVRQLGAWGLAWHDWQIPQAATVAVYPDLMGLRSLSVRLALQTTGNIRKARRMGTGTEFTELRDYSTGDDLRFVDWKATARKSRLLVRVLEPEQEQPLIILLDGGRLMTAQVRGLSRFDWGLNAALALALTALNRGDRVGMGVFDRQMHTWIPPERGAHQLPKLIERLTPLEPAMLEPDYLGAVTLLTQQQSRRALVVLLTDLIDETASAELLAALSRLAPRYLPFCVALRDPQVDTRAHVPIADIPSGYSRAVAIDLLAQRQLALAKLKEKGVLILDAPANQISDQLVDRYLQLKARNQI